MSQNIIALSDRVILEVKGNDASSFLQRIITSNIATLESQPLLWTLLLTPQGKYLWDLFIYGQENHYMLDVAKQPHENIIKLLHFYALNDDVTITVLPQYQVLAQLQTPTNQTISFPDPRTEKLGWRIYTTDHTIQATHNDDTYQHARINLGIPCGIRDLIHKESFPLHYNTAQLHAIDFTKGCFIGQEVTARMYHKASLKKSLYRIETLTKHASLTSHSPVTTPENKKVGQTCFCIGNHGLAILDNTIQHSELLVGNTPITFVPC